MKQLTQAIFKDAPDWVESAAVNSDGDAYWYNSHACHLAQSDSEHFINAWITRQSKFIGEDYDTADWQNSAIDREFN